MTAHPTVKARNSIAAVIASPAALRTALALAHPPDLFELRLDALYPVLPEIERDLEKLRSPFILTARHPQEGGKNNLSAGDRSALLLEFLSRGAYVDVELRSVNELRPVLHAAADQGIKRIISVHEMERALAANELQQLLDLAEAQNADIFKTVMRTDTAEEVSRLVGFFTRNRQRMPMSAMGVGSLGREARIALAHAGSVLNYAHLGSAQTAGQLSLTEMRRELGRA